MESRNLVIVFIRSNEGLGRIGSFYRLDMAAGNILFSESFKIGLAIHTDGCHDVRRSTQKLEVVGNIAGTAAEFPSHAGNEKTDVDIV